ncbi:sugar-binding domain-containing protein [Globicatella sulfidifaciens]|uniref:sugar-binding transcriptional regulator n=1 Tax=Globicatella sulfidifaciens TaxID=136093 RepID=UPI00288CF179|nr:sugar-binding domain-containing protein [Globicatella sulfidifaciens]MDT2767623.1 sugar-binding domain-containing protein [Globicatella sulfidifaciens]
MEDSSNKEYEVTKVAWYYYVENLTQQKIAEIMGVSRITVNKMLDEARNKGIIQFNIPLQNLKKIELENKLKEKYNLEDVLIIPTGEEENLKSILGKAAAIYIENLLENNSYINIGYGETLNSLIDNLTKTSEKSFSIISLTGGVMPYLPYYSNSNNKLSLNLIPAPLFMDNLVAAEKIQQEKSVQDIFDLSSLASLSVTGIGELSEEATIQKTGIVSSMDLKKMKMKGAVADILMHFIDKDGNLIQSEYENKLISTSLEKLRGMKNIIAVAAGDKKVNAIDASMKTRIFNRLITDENTARQLILKEND